MIIGCASQKGLINTKDGSYKIKIAASSVTIDSAIIYGYIYDEKSKTPIKSGGVKLDGVKRYVSDTAGKYVINLKPGRYTFQGQGYGYYWPTTKKIKISQGDSVRLDFFLKEDLRPLY